MKVHFVKKARKADKYAGIKKGQSYFWWKFRRGGIRKSKTPPKRSQLTQSAYYSTVYSLQDDNRTPPTAKDFADRLEEIKGEVEGLRDQCQESFDNIPENFQSGQAAETLQERIDKCEEVISELEGIETDIEEKELEERNEVSAERWDEVLSALDNLSDV